MSQPREQPAPTLPNVARRSDVLLTLQVALLGEISTEVRGVTVGWGDQSIRLRFVIDGSLKEDDQESFDAVVTELLASFPHDDVSYEVVSSSAGQALEVLTLDAWAYARKETKDPQPGASEHQGENTSDL